MSEHLVNLHIIETGTYRSEALFEVSLLLDDETRSALGRGDREQWRRTLGRARRLIDEHVSDLRTAEGLH